MNLFSNPLMHLVRRTAVTLVRYSSNLYFLYQKIYSVYVTSKLTHHLGSRLQMESRNCFLGTLMQMETLLCTSFAKE